MRGATAGRGRRIEGMGSWGAAVWPDGESYQKSAWGACPENMGHGPRSARVMKPRMLQLGRRTCRTQAPRRTLHPGRCRTAGALSRAPDAVARGRAAHRHRSRGAAHRLSCPMFLRHAPLAQQAYDDLLRRTVCPTAGPPPTHEADHSLPPPTRLDAPHHRMPPIDTRTRTVESPGWSTLPRRHLRHSSLI